MEAQYLMKETQTCFVIMPFGNSATHTEEHWKSHYEDFLKPLIEEIPNLQATRARPLGGDLVGQIVTSLVTSPIVVAELTDNNPNVHWELGVRHSFKNRTVLIDESKRRPIFDLSSIGVLWYGKKGEANPSFKSDFQGAIRDCLKQPGRPDSPVFQTISGRGSLFEIIHGEEAVRRSFSVLSEIERNLEVANLIQERIRTNRNRTGRHYAVVTGRMRSAAVELLIAERYLDEPEKFYQRAEYYFDWVPRVNETLNDWRQKENRKRVEGWLSRNATKAIRDIDRFRNVLNVAVGSITSKL
jgi:hypothetical protein